MTADESELAAFAQSDQVTAAISAEPGDDRVVSGDSSLLYGSRPSRPVCDVARLAALVTNDPAVTSSWASAAGVGSQSVNATVMALTPAAVATPVVELDPMNMLLPAEVCVSDEPRSPIQLTGGSGSTGDDDMASGFATADISSDDQITQVDLDADGTDETVLSVVCSRGGSGYSTVVAAFHGPTAAPVMIGPPLDEYGRTSRSADRVTSPEPGVLLVEGAEWTPEDPLCCGSLTFSARWQLRDGEWVEVD